MPYITVHLSHLNNTPMLIRTDTITKIVTNTHGKAILQVQTISGSDLLYPTETQDGLELQLLEAETESSTRLQALIDKQFDKDNPNMDPIVKHLKQHNLT